MSPGPATCHNHPERHAIGLCVECRRAVCGECVTKVDGVNHCSACLSLVARQDQEAQERARRPGSVAAAIASGAALFLLLVVMTYGWLAVALPGGG